MKSLLKTWAICILLLWAVASLSVIVTTDTYSFFGAKVDSKYVSHFEGKMKCAYVIGWHKERKCMCFLTEYDKRFGNDKSLIASMPNACEGESDEVLPE